MNTRFTFSAADSVGGTIAVGAAILTVLILCVMLLRSERKLVSQTVGWTLMGLRLTILLLLFLTLLKPLLTSRDYVEQNARVLIAVDLSESMQTADRHATPAETLRWAQALGMLGNEQTNDLIDQWIQAMEAGAEPDWAQSGDQQLAANRRTHVQSVMTEVGEMPRHEIIRRVLSSQPRHLLNKLQETQVVDIQAFAVDTQNLTVDAFNQSLPEGTQNLPTAGTDAAKVMSDAIGDTDAQQLRAIVLLTDGRQTAPKDVLTEADRLGRLGIPVHTVPIGSIHPPKDLSVAAIDVPQSVFINDAAQVKASLLASGMTGQDVTVYLQQDGQTIDQTTMTVANDEIEATFDIRTEDPGRSEYSIATDVQPGELRDDNNSRSFVVTVVDNKASVLLVEGDARWEFRYLKNALERDNQIELSTVLFRQPYTQLLNDTFITRRLPDAATFTEQLANADVLIVGDVSPQQFTESTWNAIESAVSDDGLTVVFIPGKRYLPHGHDSQTLRRLLPVTGERQLLAERFQPSLPDQPSSVFRLNMTPEADQLAMFQLQSAEPGGNLSLAGLPGHPWVYAARPRPGASALAHIAVDAEQAPVRESAAIVHQYYGFGQVVWLGIDSTWRWRRRAGDTYHHRFWGQMVRWAARNKSAAGNDQVRLSLSDVIVNETESVEVNVRWNPALAEQLRDATVKAVAIPVVPDNGEQNAEHNEDSPQAIQEVILEPVDGSPERLTGRLPGLKAGEYRVVLNTDGLGVQLDDEVAADLLVRKELSSELANVSCNRDLLQQIAALSGGEMLEPWQLAQLPDILMPENVEQDILHETSLWDHWILLVLFLALLMTEWVVRKLNGLP